MKPLTRLMIFPILLTFLAACTLPGRGEGISTGGSGATETVVSGNCANPLFPIVDHAVWDYKGVNPVTGEYLISYEIRQVGSEGFLLSIEFDTGVAGDQEWTCDGGDLTQLEAGYGPAGVVAALGGIYGSLDTDNVTGLTLPRSISAGDSWSQTMDLSGQVHLLKDTIGSAEGGYSASYTAIGMENVTVPAGTYNALRIQVDVLYDVVVTVEEINVPMPFPVSLTLWYAPGVGLVKAENLNEIIEHENIELLRYFIP